MARRRSLPEILADDTGRIRPEVADLLMEPAHLGLNPHQGHREVLQEVPRESFRNMISFVLGLLLFSVLCLWGISYNLSSKAAAMVEKQASNSVTHGEETFVKETAEKEAPPVLHREKIKNEVNEQPVEEKKIEEERPTFIERKTFGDFPGGCR